jgi:hypothetical protein
MGNPVREVVPRCGVTLIVMLSVDAETYAGVRACALAEEPACGIVIFRFVAAVAPVLLEGELLAVGTA